MGAPVGDVSELASVEVHRFVPEFEDEGLEFITKATKHEHHLKGGGDRILGGGKFGEETTKIGLIFDG